MKKAIQVVGTALCAAILLAGCSNVTLPTVTGDASSSQTSSAKKTVVSKAPSTPSSAAKANETASSQTEVAASENDGHASGNENTVNTVSTDSEAFNKKFKNNPIDERYAAEMSTLITTQDIVQLSSQFTSYWNKEITHALDELKAKLEKSDAGKWSEIQADQKKWEDGKEAAIADISKKAQAGGGSVAQVVTSSKVMEYYRERAAALYRILYDYEPDYAYAYTK
jgi:uncharacterized protein YecT (DUF1311 family)